MGAFVRAGVATFVGPFSPVCTAAVRDFCGCAAALAAALGRTSIPSCGPRVALAPEASIIMGKRAPPQSRPPTRLMYYDKFLASGWRPPREAAGRSTRSRQNVRLRRAAGQLRGGVGAVVGGRSCQWQCHGVSTHWQIPLYRNEQVRQPGSREAVTLSLGDGEGGRERPQSPRQSGSICQAVSVSQAVSLSVTYSLTH